ncbi:MAG: Ldh family oxidoreductase [Chloroflexota bacterium]|nr:Ldh family oxidoreductase [Chloroflexota bacterium]
MVEGNSWRANPEKLTRFVAVALQKAGIPKPDADLTAEVLVQADLRGVHSHGVERLYIVPGSQYIKNIQAGKLNPHPNIVVRRGSLTTATVDGDRGLGFVVSCRAMNEAIEMARKNGSGWVSVYNSTHYGAGAYYSMMAPPHDMVGFSFTTGGNIVGAPGGRGKPVGANVISVAAPGKRCGPFVLDMATCVAPGGRMRIAARSGKKLPEGWGVNDDGTPMTDANEFNEGRGALLPLGSTIENGAYKGFGLALVVDILTGLLSGSGGAMLHTKKGGSHAFGALRVDAFPGGEDFKDQMDALIEKIHSIPPLPGFKGVMYPGERENVLCEERLKSGIPLEDEVVDSLKAMARDLGIPMDVQM